jgi:hypothetical protein
MHPKCEFTRGRLVNPWPAAMHIPHLKARICSGRSLYLPTCIVCVSAPFSRQLAQGRTVSVKPCHFTSPFILSQLFMASILFQRPCGDCFIILATARHPLVTPAARETLYKHEHMPLLGQTRQLSNTSCCTPQQHHLQQPTNRAASPESNPSPNKNECNEILNSHASAAATVITLPILQEQLPSCADSTCRQNNDHLAVAAARRPLSFSCHCHSHCCMILCAGAAACLQQWWKSCVQSATSSCCHAAAASERPAITQLRLCCEYSCRRWWRPCFITPATQSELQLLLAISKLQRHVSNMLFMYKYQTWPDTSVGSLRAPH